MTRRWLKRHFAALVLLPALLRRAFRSRKYQVWQIVLSGLGVPGGYRPVREARAEPEIVTSRTLRIGSRDRSDVLMP